MTSFRPETLTDLHTGWQVAEAPPGADGETLRALPPARWLPAAVPGSAHGALLAAGRIPDPFHGLNEAGVQWVGERTWAWRLHFDGAELRAHEELVFEGLDTWCSAWLNGAPLFRSSNMFVPLRVDVRALLVPGANELILRFDPALACAREDEARHGKRALWNGDSARLHARKAQYHFGWDWGPVLLTCGPWRPVRRHGWDVRIDDVELRIDVDPAAGSARLQVAARLAGADAGVTLEHRLFDPEGRCVARSVQPPNAAGMLAFEGARLWWPRGLGAQPLYTLETRAIGAGDTLAAAQRRVGLRTLRLVQAPVEGEPGTSFCFEVNGREFFAGGANWIPEHSLLEQVTPARVRERVTQAAAANMTMLRVWGGGVYEDDVFYDACDELGLLVWQDFMFACGLYPAHPGFADSVRAEAQAALRRLRHRACLALWCGNNEDYQLAESLGLAGPGVAAQRYEARALYERLLPEVCAELDPDRPYWPGSPYTPPAADGSDRLSSDPTVGDRHSWEVWHQQMLPYQRYHEVQARFVSEFGVQSHASLGVLEAVLPPAERYAESRALQWHNKAGSGTPDGHRRLAVYLADNVRTPATLEGQVYATQFVQAEAMRYAYQDFRRRWQRPGARACGGALVWQLNDCWPATSWAIIDHGGHPKPAWHTIRRALAPLAMALRLTPGVARVALMNALEARPLALRLRLLTAGGRCLHELRWDRDVPANASVEEDIALPAFDEPAIGELQACDPASGAELARDCAWPEPYKFHPWGAAPAPRFALTGATLQVAVDAPLKGLWLEAEGTRFGDNFIDLLPGAPRALALEGAPLGALRWAALDHPPQHAQIRR